MGVRDLIQRHLGYVISVPAFLWQFLFLFLPFLIVITASVYSRFSGFTTQFYGELLTVAHFDIIFRSLLLAFINAFLCMIVAYPVAYFVSFRARRWKNLLVFLLTLPFWVNFLVHVYSWFFILERNGLLNKFLLGLHIIREPLHLMNSLFAVTLVMFYVYLPFMVLPVYVIFEKFDWRLIEASLDLGAGKRETFWHVTFPLTLSGAQLGFFLVLGMSFGEFIIPQLLNGGKSFFVGTLISDYFIVSRNLATGSAFTCLSAIMIMVFMFVCYLIFRLIKRSAK
jgi:spermidine/putrescine transport system permease protein